jgi:hypothetical protein
LVSFKRDQATANSGIVVELKLEDFKPLLNFASLNGIPKKYRTKSWHLAGKLKNKQ